MAPTNANVPSKMFPLNKEWVKKVEVKVQVRIIKATGQTKKKTKRKKKAPPSPSSTISR
jgi:hypothetical protein